MTNVWVVRADFGTYTDHFISSGYVGIGWMPDQDLSGIGNRDELYPIYAWAHPGDTSPYVIGQQVGQIARFLLEIKPGDYVIAPPKDTEWLHYGRVSPEPSYFYSDAGDGCPYRHRRKVDWEEKRLSRSELSVPFQNTIRSSLTVFAVSQREEFLYKIGETNLSPQHGAEGGDPYRVVLNQILELDAAEFEILVGHLLTALGFEGTEVTGKSGDGGVDAIGELNVWNLAKVKVFVQAKRYSPGNKINSTTVKSLRQSIPFAGQGAFITTADFQQNAAQAALEPGFPRIGLINGSQLVDLLVGHWNEIPEEFRQRLGLKPGLVQA